MKENTEISVINLRRKINRFLIKILIIITLLMAIFPCIRVNGVEDASKENKSGNMISEEDEKVDIEEIQNEVIETNAANEELELNSRIALIYDRASGRILYERNGNKQTPMASTTKIMTAIVVLENANLNDVVTIQAKAAGIGGSR